MQFCSPSVKKISPVLMAMETACGRVPLLPACLPEERQQKFLKLRVTRSGQGKHLLQICRPHPLPGYKAGVSVTSVVQPQEIKDRGLFRGR